MILAVTSHILRVANFKDMEISAPHRMLHCGRNFVKGTVHVLRKLVLCLPLDRFDYFMSLMVYLLNCHQHDG